MDGVLWKADAPIGDLQAIFSRFHAMGLLIALVTNNGTRTPEQYVDKLRSFGVEVEPWQVITSAQGVAHLLAKDFPSGGPVFVIGEDGVLAALRDQGFQPVSIEDSQKAQAVVMGLDRAVNFAKVSEAALLIRNGVPFYATNSDKTFPTPRGEIPGAGAWISVIVTATGIEPIYAGKPAPFLLELARERLGTSRDESLVIGDRLETDISGGQNAGFPVGLVLSGVSSREQGTKWKPEVDYLAEDLNSLLEKIITR